MGRNRQPDPTHYAKPAPQLWDPSVNDRLFFPQSPARLAARPRAPLDGAARFSAACLGATAPRHPLDA
jgi:hypothetical protein